MEIGELGTNAELAQVGDTNILVFAPANAFDRPVTLHFELLPAGDPTNVPSEIEGYWWCTSVQITVEPAEAVSLLPLHILLPNRRTLTPLMVLSGFAKRLDTEWQVFDIAANMSAAPSGRFAKPNFQAPLPNTLVAGDGNHSVLTIQVGRKAVDAPSSPINQLVDGTSNTIVAGTGVLETDRVRGMTPTLVLDSSDVTNSVINSIMVIAVRR